MWVKSVLFGYKPTISASLIQIISKAQSAQIHYTFNHQLTPLAFKITTNQVTSTGGFFYTTKGGDGKSLN